MRTHTAIRLLTAALLAAGALSLAACGADDDPAATAADRENAAREAGLRHAQCMRENGVDMPDPEANGGRQMFKVGPGEESSPEEFEAAQEACSKHMEGVEPPELSDEQLQEHKDAALAHSRCMRENGVEDFPDPTFDEDGGTQIRLSKGSGIDPDDPDFREAEEACQDTMPTKPSAGSAP